MFRRALVAVVLVLVGLPSLSHADYGASCGLGRRSQGFHYRTHDFAGSPIVMYGDSITYQAWRGLAAKHPTMAVDAYWGRPTSDAVSALREDLRDSIPDVVIMAVGTNDIGSPVLFGEEVKEVRALLPRATRLLWVFAYDDKRAGWRDLDLRTAAVPGVQVVDWATPNLLARGTSDHSPLLYDGKHLSCRGADEWVSVIDQAITPHADLPISDPTPPPAEG